MNEESLKYKKRFNTKQNREDGLILQLHHIVENDNIKNVHHIKFIHADFDYICNQLSACDLQQNIFIVNFHFNQYWLIPNEKSYMAVFVPSKKNLLLIALKTGVLHFIQTENGERVGILEGHTKPVKYISFSNDSCCLTASEQQAIIWNIKSNTQIHHLQLDNKTTFKYICFMPVSCNIFACYNDDVIHVWKNNNFQILQEIHPSAWKGKNFNSIAFTRNGRALVIGGKMPYLVVFSIDTWTLERIIHLPTEINGVRQILFIPQLFDGGSNRILGVLSLKNTLYFFDMEDNKFINQKQSNETYTCINKFYCSPDAKYLACILNTGELDVYLSKLTKITELLCKKKEKYPLKSKNITKLKAVKIKKVDNSLDINRLIDILKQFGEYPAEYRTLIWKIILKLPENQTEFTSLVSRGYHPAFRDLQTKYPLESHLSILNLKRILSVLANWCPLFSQVENFPFFVFPFVRIFHNDPLVNFEVILTIIMNWCQYWFEYFPFPPLNLTSMIENILADQDPILLKYLNDYGVSSVLYGWSLLETAFSEIMTRSEWLQFWDHVISNDTSFLTIATAAYNIYKRSTIMTFKCYEQFEYFYHNQNSINMNSFIKQCYQLFYKINRDIHPAKYFEEFQPLQKGSYPTFTRYPKQMIDYQTENINKIREQEMQLEKEEFEIIEQKAAQLAKLKQQIRENENDIRMKNLQQTYKQSLEEEQNRLTERHRKLNKLKQELHEREIAILNETKQRLMEKNVEERSSFLDRTIDQMDRTRYFNEMHDKSVEQQTIQRNQQLFKQREYLKQLLNIKFDEYQTLWPEHTVIQQQQEQISKSFDELFDSSNEDRYMNQLKLADRITILDNTLQQVELSLAREMASRQNLLISNHAKVKNSELESITNKLENDVAHLLEKLAEYRINETQTRLREISLNTKDREQRNSELSEQRSEYSTESASSGTNNYP